MSHLFEISAFDRGAEPPPRPRPTLSVDFDGVLHAYTSGWKGASVIPDGPVPGAIAWLARMADHMNPDGFKVVVCSARASRPWGWWAVRRWLRLQLFEHFGSDMTRADDIASGIEVTNRKPAAIVYIDDRAWRFDGKKFPTEAEIMAHRPWCAKGKGP